MFVGGADELMARKQEIDDRRDYVLWLDQRLGDMVKSTPFHLLAYIDRYMKWHHFLSRQEKAADKHATNLSRLFKMDEWESLLDGDEVSV